MTIGNIPGNGYIYNSYAMNRIPSVDVSQVQKMPEKQEDRQSLPVQEKQLPDIPIGAKPVDRPSVDLEELSLTFNREDSFDRIGSDSDIGGLDMEKAISDMKKDQILQDYSYFVGTAPATIHSMSEDGIVIAK